MRITLATVRQLTSGIERYSSVCALRTDRSINFVIHVHVML